MKESGHPCENAFKLNVDDLDADETGAVIRRAAELALDELRGVSRPDDLGGGHMPVLANDADGDGDEPEDDDDDDDEAQSKDNAQSGEGVDEQKIQQRWVPPEANAPIVPGWILRKRLHVPPAEPHWVNDEFTPLRPESTGDPDAVVAFPSFHLCVDDFFTKLEEHKVEESKAQHAQNVYAKVDRIRVDHERRIGQLEAERSASERQASMIEANLELVDRALMMLNTMVASQVDWGELWREVKRQQRLGHPIAQHIQSLDLDKNMFNMLLGLQTDDDEFDLEDETPMEVVPLDLGLSAHANIARLHSKKKEFREKTSKTEVASGTVIKQAERRAQQDLKKFEFKQSLRRVRQTWWFEKFFWFISSENYLVFAARDAQQAEQLFCKHVHPNDVFVQADVQGARSCFIKNTVGGEVPPATLREAGTMVLCHSGAWDKNMRISAWWVLAEQVVRPGPGAVADDDSIMVDGYLVRGHRRFMPPVHIEMGLTLLFHVGEASADRHRGERRSRYREVIGTESAEPGVADGNEAAAAEIEPSSDTDPGCEEPKLGARC
jgi:hypothetical protein